MQIKNGSYKTIGICISCIALMFVNGQCFAQHTGNRPNIIFIMADDHDMQSISSYGSKLIQTPGIDRLANEGMRFNNCFSVNSICAPSRADLITGKYNQLNGVLRIGDKLDEKQLTFPMLLQQAGYTTALIGKWHLVSEPQGFDYYNVLPGQGQYFNCLMKEKGQPWLDGNKGGIPSKGFITDVITDRSIEWLKNNNTGNPFFLMIHHKAPHTPHEYPGKYDSLYAHEDIPLPETFNDDYAGKNPGLQNENAGFSRLDHIYPDHIKEKAAKGLSKEQFKYWAYQSFFKGYLRLVASLDENISRLLQYLDESGLSKNTIVVYTSDNGFFMGEHGLFNKMWMYEESMRLPLLIRYPGIVKAGSVNNEMVSILDFAATFTDIAKAKISPEMQGRSIVPLLKGEMPKDWRDAIYYHYFDQYEVPEHVGIRSKQYKLIQFFDKKNNTSFKELYDLKTDPHELKNIYYTTSNKALKDKLENALNKMRIKFERLPDSTSFK